MGHHRRRLGHVVMFFFVLLLVAGRLMRRRLWFRNGLRFDGALRGFFRRRRGRRLLRSRSLGSVGLLCEGAGRYKNGQNGSAAGRYGRSEKSFHSSVPVKDEVMTRLPGLAKKQELYTGPQPEIPTAAVLC